MKRYNIGIGKTHGAPFFLIEEDPQGKWVKHDDVPGLPTLDYVGKRIEAAVVVGSHMDGAGCLAILRGILDTIKVGK